MVEIAQLSDIEPKVEIALGGNPDWLAVTHDAVWISNGGLACVQRVDVASNRVIESIRIPGTPCSGLATAFRSVWAPFLGGERGLARIRTSTNAIEAIVPVRAANSEGGVAAGASGVWIVDSRKRLTRVGRDDVAEPTLTVPGGAVNTLFYKKALWLSDHHRGLLLRIDPLRGVVTGKARTGPKPRFLTGGAGSVWVLNQGDWTITRVDVATMRVRATIRTTAHRGSGGAICYGGGSIWLTRFGAPLTRISVARNEVVATWTGNGGDEVAYGHGSVWLTDYERGLLWRIPAGTLSRRR